MDDKRLIHWKDIGHVARVWQESDATMNFEVLELAAEYEDGELLYWVRGAASAFPGTTDPDLARVAVSGFIKFDGCSHWLYNTDVMQHICGREDLDRFTAMQGRLYDEAARVIEGWCA